MVEIKNLFLKYTREYYALYDINLNIEDGEAVANLKNQARARFTFAKFHLKN